MCGLQKGHDVTKTEKSILKRGWSKVSSRNRRLRGMATALDMTEEKLFDKLRTSGFSGL